MTPEERKLLEETATLVKENHAILTALHRSMVWGRVWRLFYWILIIGISVGAFYFIQPYLDSALKLYDTGSSNVRSIGDILKNPQQLIKNVVGQ